MQVCRGSRNEVMVRPQTTMSRESMVLLRDGGTGRSTCSLVQGAAAGTTPDGNGHANPFSPCPPGSGGAKPVGCCAVLHTRL